MEVYTITCATYGCALQLAGYIKENGYEAKCENRRVYTDMEFIRGSSEFNHIQRYSPIIEPGDDEVKRILEL